MNKRRYILIAAGFAVYMAAAAQESTGTEVNAIEKTVYWFDGDAASAKELTTSSINLENLSKGVHTITVQTVDSKGLWSSAETRFFVVPRSAAPATTVSLPEYWIDGHAEKRFSLPKSVSLEYLSQGVHTISFRAQDDTGLWSSAETRFFVVTETNVHIARYQYWFDDAQDDSQTGTVSDDSGLAYISFGSLTPGEHTLSWRVGDSKGAWSDVMTDTFTVELITTGIDDASQLNEKDPATWFSIDGRKGQGALNKGVYIVNGRKIIVK